MFWEDVRLLMNKPQAVNNNELDRLRRELRFLKLFVVAATVVMAALGLAAVKWMNSRKELTTERINIVDGSGVLRLVIANSDRFPLPKLNGKMYPRALHPAGLVFYDASGSELGGLAITDTKQIGRVSALAFDYPNYDAVGLLTRLSADGKNGIAGLQINSRPPPELDVVAASKVVRRRISIHNENENAEILLSDPQGRDRIRLRVDAEGDALIEILDADGRVTFSAPQNEISGRSANP